MTLLAEIFKTKRIIGVIGSRNTGKSSLVLSELLQLKKEFPETKIYVLGVENSLRKYLEKQGINFLNSKKSLLDLRLKNSVLFIDEFGELFSTETRDKQQDKLTRFFNRINHQNCFVVLTSARQNFWNKYMCGLVNAFLVCKVEFNELVNGTSVKEIVKGIETTSDYFLDINTGDYYYIGDDLVELRHFDYCPELDVKAEQINPFIKKESEKK